MAARRSFTVGQIISAMTKGQRFKPKWAEDIENGIRPEFDPSGEGYDYATALNEGVRRSSDDGHMASRAPSGRILKGAKHPTFHKTLKGEDEAGYEVFVGEDGNLYSRPKKGK